MVRQYQRILFPDRAENLSKFQTYKVFLDFWDSLAEELQTFYESMATRGETRCLVVYGPQGSGKTLFARKLVEDFHIARGRFTSNSLEYDRNNLWHRMTAGGNLASVGLLEKATINTEILHIEDDPQWVERAVAWRSGQTGRNRIVVADNAERGYFLQSLLKLDDAQFIQLGSTDAAAKLAAQRFVSLARGDLRGCLFLILTNDDLFALGLEEAVSLQQKDLLRVRSIPAPTSRDKELVVRVNTNRLNEISYWFCLDKAGPEEKRTVYTSLSNASTFPDSFAAVDRAIRSAEPSRIGRPAKKNVLSLIVLHKGGADSQASLDDLGELESEPAVHDWLQLRTYKTRWANSILEDSRQASLLESEWQLRVVTLGEPFAGSLLSRDLDLEQSCRELLSTLQQIQGPGTHENTRRAYNAKLARLVSEWPTNGFADTTAFWQRGQARANEYEDRLRILLDRYNTNTEGFLSYRPDYVISPFRPCSILDSKSEEKSAINEAIRRDAHVFEFAALTPADSISVRNYLKKKLPNYVLKWTPLARPKIDDSSLLSRQPFSAPVPR